ncbi:hypothetical protein KP509_25G040700 [Ceratopteris richardii]|uniref:Uncharacterized protein n=1 Tax=Ceratopteris richardii TaxID=49495 RepID=A0A8T2RQJ2_CERRI|nr:hypothetical protein KP509_25G040700 [Ceratopteris richardii]
MDLEQELEQQGRKFTQEQVVGVGDYEEEDEEDLQEQDRDSTVHDETETMDGGSSTPTGRQTDNFYVHLHSETEMQHSRFSSQFSNDPETRPVPFATPMPSNADLFGSIDGKESFGSFPSKQVEGVLQSCLAAAEVQVSRILQQAMNTVQSQVLQALHQAARDIIEHLSKEAAHKVVVAERKAALLELEMSSLKQQALSMLLRMKADLDAQALDADKKYLLERRRAQDAEARLAVAQDISKRLKAELKKKADILEKMQKLVQPMIGNHPYRLHRSMKLPDHLENYATGGDNDKLRKMVGCNAEIISSTMSNVALNQEVQCSEVQPDIEPDTHAPDHSAGRDYSFSGEAPSAQEDSVELQKQSCSSCATLQTVQCCPNLLMDNNVSKKTGNGRDDQVEVSEYVEGSSQTKSKDKSAEPLQGIELLLSADGLDEKVSRIPVVCQKSSYGEGKFQDSSAAVKGYYVRRKAKENGKFQEKKASSMTMENHYLYIDLEHDLKSSTGRSSNETASEYNNSIPEDEYQTSSLINDSQTSRDATDSSNPGHIEQVITESCEDLANDPPEKMSSSEISRGAYLDSDMAKDDAVLETARPDIEVATSLAELASANLEVSSREIELSHHRFGNHDIFLKPGRTGLRMKRKGISFERKVMLQSEADVSKKSRPEDSYPVLSDNHTERVLRRNRGRKHSMLKGDLSLESSGDRRLIQGARQLLCLAEKKW